MSNSIRYNYLTTLMNDSKSFEAFKKYVASTEFIGFDKKGIDRWEAKASWKSKTGWIIEAYACLNEIVEWTIKPPTNQYEKSEMKKFYKDGVNYEFDGSIINSKPINEFNGVSKFTAFKDDVSKILNIYENEIFPNSKTKFSNINDLREAMVKEKLNMDPDAKIYFGKMIRTGSSTAFREFLIRHGVKAENFNDEDGDYFIYCNQSDYVDLPYFLIKEKDGTLVYKPSFNPYV